MTHEGLYIPMLSHIHSRCMTGQFGQCHHYIQGRGAIKNSGGQFGLVSEGSRRRYRRMSARIPLRIVDCGYDDGSDYEMLDAEAFAVDLSWGGIRLATKFPLPVRKTVAFTFGQEDMPFNVDGHGEVRWSREISPGGFQAGLLVTDKKTFETLGLHMAASELSPPL